MSRGGSDLDEIGGLRLGGNQQSARHHSLSRVLRAIRAHRKLNTTYFPWIKIAGVWLEDAGFEAGERVRITVEDKRLIITPM
ncbi:SymE family type I addiction module toxin [Burkholderia cenocepacia]|nr:SymE family type I addiction module toxin [Burkholderia cenocepacia]